MATFCLSPVNLKGITGDDDDVDDMLYAFSFS